MNNQQAIDIKKLPDDPAYRLAEIELYNWGPFSDLNQAEIDSYGTAVIGQTGSGKTTLVDALMTLIAQKPKYNLASTGGHESDRDLISYIRGVTGAGNESASNDHILRPGKTVTGVSAYFKSSKNVLHLTGVFWIDGSSSANADLKRAWIFSKNSQLRLTDFLHVFQERGMRGLKQLGQNEDGLKVYDSKKSYLAQIRRYFEVSDNAFTLLNRAAGLKQLNSIDDLFRELVLDDHSAFKRATEVAAEFDDLASIHTELEIAQKQQQTLLPIKIEYDKFIKNSEILSKKQNLLLIFPKWFALHLYQLWQAQENTAAKKIKQFEQVAITLDAQVNVAQENTDQCRDIYAKLGGASIEQLQQQIEQQLAVVNTCKLHIPDYQQLATRLKLDSELTAPSLAKNQQRAEQLQIEQQSLFEEKEQFAWDQGARQQQQLDRIKELETEIDNIKKSPGSNIPSHFQSFRSELAESLFIDEHELPFVAELLQVKSEQSIWRGAIERAVGSHRLRLLVPPDKYSAALNWINSRNNRLHVRLLNVKVPEKLAYFLDDGFTRKLNFKSHTHREALKFLLASIDRHCVDSPQSFKETSHAMTKEGLMSGKKGFSEKQDQKRLNQDWMTGFDNRDRLSQLGQDLSQKNAELIDFESLYKQAKQACSQIQQNITLLKQLCTLDFSQIDIATAQTQLQTYQSNLQSLLDPDSDTAVAKLKWEKAKQHLKSSDEWVTKNKIEIARAEDKRCHAQQQKENAYERTENGLNNEQQTSADNYFNKPTEQDIPNLSDIEREAANNLQNTINKFTAKVNDNTGRLARLMEKAKIADTGALVEADTQLEDIPAYLTQLNTLNEEALPEKQNRFLAYLNQSSDQGVTQLLSNIENEDRGT